MYKRQYYETERIVGFVSIYETMTGKLQWKTWSQPGDEGKVLSVSFRLDDTVIISGGEDGYCRLWSVVDGTPITKVGLGCPVTYVCFCVNIEEQRKRCIAVAMGGHERLGAASILAGVPDDLMDKILKFV